MIDIWAGASLPVIFKEILKDTFDQFRNQLKFLEFWVGLLYVLDWLRRSALKKKLLRFDATSTNRSPPENVKQTVVCLRTALILMCRPSLPGLISHLSSKQGRPLTRCTQRRSAGKKMYKAPSRLLPAKQPVSTKGQTRGRPPSRAGAEVRRITSTPTLTFPRSLGCRQTTSATPLLASPGSRPRALSPPLPILTPPSPTCHQMSRRSTATSEHPAVS